jgi:hypothetical protein
MPFLALKNLINPSKNQLRKQKTLLSQNKCKKIIFIVNFPNYAWSYLLYEEDVV